MKFTEYSKQFWIRFDLELPTHKRVMIVIAILLGGWLLNRIISGWGTTFWIILLVWRLWAVHIIMRQQ